MLSFRQSLVAAGVLSLASAALAAPPAPDTASKAPLFAAKTIQVTEVVSIPGTDGKLLPRARLNITYTAPAKARIEEYEATAAGQFPAAPDVIFADNGTTLYQYQSVKKQYMKETGDDAAGFPSSISSEFTSDLGTASGKQTVDGKSLTVYTQTTPSEDGLSVTTTKTWVDPATQLFYRRVVSVTKDKKTAVSSQIDYSNWSLDKTIDTAQYTWVPPAGVTEYVEPQLLADGTTAPDFTVQDKDGKPVKLSDYAGKVVVIDFWATWCNPCMASMPHTNAIAKKFADKDVVVLAVNVSDSKDAFEKWLPQHPEYSSLHFAIDPSAAGKGVDATLYNVTGIPTQYIIGKDGKVVHHIVGYGGPSPELENAIQTAQAPAGTVTTPPAAATPTPPAAGSGN